jgi:transposase
MKAAEIGLCPAERAVLEGWARAPRTEQRRALRARLVLFAAEGMATGAIAARLGIRASTVSKWRGRFARLGLEGLEDAPRGGRPARYDATTEARILAQLDAAPPPGFARWNGRLLAAALGDDISPDQVWRVLRAQRISLARRRSWCVSTDPEFAAKAADIVGLYLNPPEHAVVLCVDEKPHIQALERAQGWLRLPNGQALSGFAHRYKRHGTTTLFAALEVTTGLVKTGHYQRRRRAEFLDFMNEVVAVHPEREIHVVLDNLNTHKPKCDRWRARHKNVHFHFTPTYASWLNMIEIWFSLLQRHALAGASFTSPQQLRAAIDAYVRHHNASAAPFEWRKTTIQPKPLRHYIANLYN